MPRPDTSISLADLAAAGVRLRPFEVTTIVRELALQVARGECPGVPSAHVIRLSPSGALFVEGPVAAGGRSVARAAQLLDTLLPGFDAPPELRAPGALRLVLARALGTMDLPPYVTLEAFAEALARFAATDAAAVVRQLVATWSESVAAGQPGEASEAGEDELAADDHEGVDATERVLESFAPAVPMPEKELTVSDLRRARRATGLTLTQVSERCRVPVTLLRELEWGYLVNWPSGHYGRTQLVRYARAAGLDEEVVVRTVWPILEEQTVQAVENGVAAPVPETAARAEAPLDSVALTRADLPAASIFSEAQRPPSSRGSRVLAALAIPALLAIAIAPAVWYRPKMTFVQPSPSATITESAATTAPPAATEPPATAAERPAPSVSEPDRLVPAETAPPAPRAPLRVADGQSDDAPAAGFPPVFSSVGSAMFHSPDPGEGAGLVPAGASGEGAILRITRIVDDRGRNFNVRPSPDGTRIAFDSDRDGERAVYVADADGQHVRRITGEGFAALPSWSPDGQSLAFVRAERDNPQVWNLWTTNLATGAFQRLTDHETGQPWGGSWFPDGAKLAYAHDDRIIVLDLAGGGERVLESPRKGRMVRLPVVSPDGRHIVFQVVRDGVWLLELSDGSMRRVLSDPTADEFTWSPDGTRVAYHSERLGSWGVWLMASR